MDTKQLTESDGISIRVVNESPSKKIIILSAGAMKPNREGQSKFNCLVEIDGTQKGYMPNKTTLRLLQAKYGFESSSWVGKSLQLSVGTIEGKTAIIGTPI